MTRTSFSARTEPVTVAHFCPAQASVPGTCRRSALAATRVVALFLRSREWGTSSAPRGEVLAVDGDASVRGASDPPASSSAAIWRGSVDLTEQQRRSQARRSRSWCKVDPWAKRNHPVSLNLWSPPMHRHFERVHFTSYRCFFNFPREIVLVKCK